MINLREINLDIFRLNSPQFFTFPAIDDESTLERAEPASANRCRDEAQHRPIRGKITTIG